MSQHWIAPTYGGISEFIMDADTVLLTVLITLICCPTLLLVWRLWTFTIKPAMHPDEPRELPYWIPCHALRFVKNGQKLLIQAREHFHHTREPFALTLGGEKIYFLTAAKDVAAVCRNTSAFAFHPVVFDLSIQFGVSRSAMERIYHKPMTREEDLISNKLKMENPQLKSLQDLNSGLFKEQLHPGKQQDLMLEKYSYFLLGALQLQRLPSASVTSPRGKHLVVSLLRWTQGILLDAATEIFFGRKLQELNADLIKNFMNFDDENWKLWYKWSGAGEMHSAKEKIIATLQDYLSLKPDERPNATPLLHKIEETQRAIGLSERDIATNLALMYWVVATNGWKLCFWALAYLLHNPTQLEAIRLETGLAMLPDGKLSFPHVSTACPQLDAILSECLRIFNATASIRIVTEPVCVGGKRFHPGARIVCPVGELHSDSQVFGPDPSSFDPGRFIRDKTLIRSEYYRPFGAGLSLCPGRFTAKQTVKAFIAIALYRFDITLAGEQAFPAKEDGKPTTGMMSPAKGEGVFINVSARSQ